MENAKASVEVTKSLKQINGNLMAIDQTFYVALYSDAEYIFYDVTFTVDGNEAELPKGAAEIRMEFKNIPILEKTMQQMHGLFL